MYLVVLYCVALCCSDFEWWVWYAYCCWVVVCVVLLCGFGLLRWFDGLLFLFLDFVVCCDIDSPDSGWVSWFWWWVCFEVGFRDCFGLGGLCILVYCRFGFRGYFGVGCSLGLLTFCLLFGLWDSIVFVVVLRVVACRCVGCWLIVVVCLLVICGFMCCGLGVE